MTLQEERKMYAEMMGEYSVCTAETMVTAEEMDAAISDCYAMLLYSIDRNDRSEIAYWRKMIQENKVQRRKMLAI